MNAKLFVEPQGKAREQVVLESCVPLDMKLFRQWMKSWIPNKEFKKWNKDLRSIKALGEIRPGKIVEATRLDSDGASQLKGDFFACRSYITESTGAKKKLPLVLIVRLKTMIDYDYFASKMALNTDQDAEIKEALKEDVWAPIAVWHPQTVDRKQVINAVDVLAHAIQYTKALFFQDLKSGDFCEFIETEILKR
ncbi:MAG: hypothetical protein JW779_03230 [Candidatus Thorarchaeota archaeon]|nr:hypothetical protein [Candidatus Thorarchaeota archaeon]